ncbi:hypothetical protein [Bradyrhizobium liaoningense]|uniref:hypothetical protein n=1 Tax=Bradyrhizobium liaoningense TaxID=43992 RepID=UPI001BA72E42|nr:hypothetical protein [Bradyrhizobium liaoningense]MBR0713989.1 hypothetical protein [Bradyrhizobium liaoningense]
MDEPAKTRSAVVRLIYIKNVREGAKPEIEQSAVSSLLQLRKRTPEAREIAQI